jgi:acyl-coenzyme A thioesterase PaaI-like protein
VGEKAIARAYLVRAGKTLCVSRIDIFDDARNLAAIAIVTYMLLVL